MSVIRTSKGGRLTHCPLRELTIDPRTEKQTHQPVQTLQIMEMNLKYFRSLMQLIRGSVTDLLIKSSKLLQAKDLLFCSEIVKPVSQLHQPSQNLYQYDLLPVFIQQLLDDLVMYWFRKLSQCHDSQSHYSKPANRLASKAQQYKANTNLFTKEQQYLSQIEETIEKFSIVDDPIQYYDMKRRRNIRQSIQNKLALIETTAQQTQQSSAPMYCHKLEREIRQEIFNAYEQQTSVDRQVIAETWNLYHQVSNKLHQVAKRLPQTSVYFLQSQKHLFFAENWGMQALNGQEERVRPRGKIFREKSNSFDSKFSKYQYALSIRLKNNYSYWGVFRKSLQHMVQSIEHLRISLQNSHNGFEAKQQQIYKYLQEIPSSLGIIFRVDIILNCIKKLHKNFELIRALGDLKEKVSRDYDEAVKMQLNSKEYIGQIKKQMGSRAKKLRNFYISDRSFFEQHALSEKTINHSLLNSFKQFLHQAHAILKEIGTMFEQNGGFTLYEQTQVINAINHCTAEPDWQDSSLKSQTNSLSNSQAKTNRKNSASSLIPSTKLSFTQKNPRKVKIEDFLHKLVVIDFDAVNLGENVYSAALGPKFLLHGQLAIRDEGVYFASVFNRKNLFFGKTHLFIPREDITEVDEKNTLFFFPDCVQMATNHGSLYFHALGQRKRIFSTLIAHFFPQNNADEQNSCLSEVEFRAVGVAEAKIPEEQIAKLMKPLESPIVSHTFKNCKVPKFFRRYLSDDEFEIKGQVHPNFKSYFLTLIEAKNPQSTPITPSPPPYFCLETQPIPEEFSTHSHRIHTYLKILPKIPFVSKGGQGICEQEQIYHWCSPDLVIIELTSILKGFYLAEGMRCKTKNIIKQQGQDVSFTASSEIVFASNSSTNSLLKSPVISSIRAAFEEMMGVIEKYEKGKRSRRGKTSKNIDKFTNEADIEQMSEQIQTLTAQNHKLRSNIKIMAIIFAGIYFFSMFWMLMK